MFLRCFRQFPASFRRQFLCHGAHVVGFEAATAPNVARTQFVRLPREDGGFASGHGAGLQAKVEFGEVNETLLVGVGGVVAE